MNIPSILMLIGFVGACFLAAATGVAFPPGDWYERLAKPFWRPPNWLFAPAWTILYMTIAVSGWLVWGHAGFAGAALPLATYLAQLTLNAAWAPIFFGLRRPDLAFFEIVLLWFSIIATITLFHPVHAGAAWLLSPYLAWVTFAAALNLTVWRLNPASTSSK
jgi:translocator protein